jgi:YebC/PmpR family DNA-binding regulatory protein
MPLDNITRAIKKGTGELPGVQYEALTYEGSGPGGLAIMIEILTDNNNRTVGEMRHLFSKYQGTLGASGAVAWMFDHLGVIRTTAPASLTEDQLLEALMEYDVQDISIEEDLLTVITSKTALNDVREALIKINITIEHAELEWVAKNPIDLAEDKEESVHKLLEKLEEQDDVQNIFTNLS